MRSQSARSLRVEFINDMEGSTGQLGKLCKYNFASLSYMSSRGNQFDIEASD